MTELTSQLMCSSICSSLPCAKAWPNMKHAAMALQLALILSLSLAGVVVVGGSDSAPTSTHLQFYMHDLITPYPGAPATAVRVVKGPTARFGDTYAIDDALTEGPDAASGAVGRAQGFYMEASQTETALVLCVNMVFTAGPHNGSTVTVLGRDVIFDKVRELPVVGGTGTLRGVTGYGLLTTHTVNITDGNAVLKIDMYLKLSEWLGRDVSQ